MPKKQPLHDDKLITAAVLRLAAKHGWTSVDIETLAKTIKVSSATLKKRFSHPLALVPVVAKEIDAEAFKLVDQSTGTPHEILFDIMMARFDVLQLNRQAILSMATAARRDPALSWALGQAALEGVYRVIDRAQLRHMPRPFLAASLSAIYAWTFCAWRKDTSPDMAKTMATLDRMLKRTEKMQALFGRFGHTK